MHQTHTAMNNQASLALIKFLSNLAKRLGVGRHVYVVGGAVRNFVMDPTGKKYPVKDIDVVIDSLALRGKDSMWFAKEVAKAIPAQTNIATNQYGVALLHIVGDWMLGDANLKGEDIEIANARTESYTDGGYTPDTVEKSTIEQDVYRREFTFNSLLWRLQDLAQGPDKAEIIDLTGCGLQDLQEGVMRCPSSPDKTFTDDPSRMIRAIKFLVKYGFKISSEVERSIRKNKSKIKNIPPAHLSNMLINTFLREPTGKKALIKMQKLGLLDEIKDIAKRDKSFRDALGNWADREAKVGFIFDLMDMGLPSGKTLSFLDRHELARVREITVGLSSDASRQYIAMLRQPGKVVDTRALMQEFNLKGSAVRQIVDAARRHLLSDPALSSDAQRLTQRVRTDLKGGRTATLGRQAAGFPIYAALVYLSRTKDRGFDPECGRVQDIIQSLKDGDPGAANYCAKILSRHPGLRGFRGVIVPAPRSSSQKAPLVTFAKALVHAGVGSQVAVAVVRDAPVEASRMRRRRGLPGVAEQDHRRSMGAGRDLVGPEESVLIVDDIFTTGATIRAVAATLRRNGHRGSIIGATAGYYEPDAGKAKSCSPSFARKAHRHASRQPWQMSFAEFWATGLTRSTTVKDQAFEEWVHDQGITGLASDFEFATFIGMTAFPTPSATMRERGKLKGLRKKVNLREQLQDRYEREVGVHIVKSPLEVTRKADVAKARTIHKRAIRRALRSGALVPPDVLAEYPELSGRRAAVKGSGIKTGLMLPLPKDLADQFPSLGDEDDSPSHCTFLSVGDVRGREAEFLRVVRDEARGFSPVRATLQPVDYFVHPEKGRVVAYCPVRFSGYMDQLRDRIRTRLVDQGFPIQDRSPLVYQPHVTLGYLDGLDSVWKGPVPTGSWMVDGIVAWGLPKETNIPMGRKAAVPKKLNHLALQRYVIRVLSDRRIPRWEPFTFDGVALEILNPDLGRPNDFRIRFPGSPGQYRWSGATKEWRKSRRDVQEIAKPKRRPLTPDEKDFYKKPPQEIVHVLQGIPKSMLSVLGLRQELLPPEALQYLASVKYTFGKRAKKFELNIGDPILSGKYLNSPGRIESFGQDAKGDPTVTVRKKPKGDRGQGAKKETKLFKVRFDGEQAKRDKRAFEYESREALKNYLHEYPHAKTGGYTIKGRWGGLNASPDRWIKDRVGKALRGIGSRILGTAKSEMGKWKAVGGGIRKLFSRQHLSPNERRQLVTYSVRQALSLGLRSTVYGLIPPPPGYVVVQAISVTASKLLDKELGKLISGGKTASVERDFGRLLEQAMSKAMVDVLKQYKGAVDKVAERFVAHQIRVAGTWGVEPWAGDSPLDDLSNVLSTVDGGPAFETLGRILRENQTHLSHPSHLWSWIGTLYLTADALQGVPVSLIRAALVAVRAMPEHPDYTTWVSSWKHPDQFPVFREEILRDLERALDSPRDLGRRRKGPLSDDDLVRLWPHLEATLRVASSDEIRVIDYVRGYKQISGVLRIPIARVVDPRTKQEQVVVGLERIKARGLLIRGKPYLSTREMNALFSGEVVVEEKVDGHPVIVLYGGYTFFCEALKIQHTVAYDHVPYSEMGWPDMTVVYEIMEGEKEPPYQRGSGKWLSRSDKESLCRMIGAPLVPLVFKGRLRPEDVPKMASRISSFGSGEAEGVVIKNLGKGVFGKFINLEFQQAISDDELEGQVHPSQRGRRNIRRKASEPPRLRGGHWEDPLSKDDLVRIWPHRDATTRSRKGHSNVRRRAGLLAPPHMASRDLRGLAYLFLAEAHPSLDTTSCDATKGRCDGVSSRLYHWLADRGIKSTLIQATGLIPPLGSGANADWVAFVGGDLANQQFLSHVVVRVENMVVDLTAAQFGLSSGPVVEPLSAFKKRWVAIKPFRPWGRSGGFDPLAQFKRDLWAKTEDLADFSVDQQERVRNRPYDTEDLGRRARQYGVTLRMPPTPRDINRAVRSLLSTDSDDSVGVHSLVRDLQDLRDTFEERQTYEEVLKGYRTHNYLPTLDESERNLVVAQKQVGAAAKRAGVSGRPVLRANYDPNDIFQPVSSFDVDLNGATFTIFLSNGKVAAVDDVLEGGDTSFFHSPSQTKEYFDLVRELRKPGSSKKGVSLTLWTARPVRDRATYLRARTVPPNIFLTNNPDRAFGLGRDLGGGKGRDIWKVRINSAHLVQTLDAGRVKDYQVVGSRPVPIQGIWLEQEGGRVGGYSKRAGSLILYHGTNKVFRRFDLAKVGKRDSGNLGRGFYLSKDPTFAMRYAEDNARRWGGDPVVLKVRANLRRVADFYKLIPRIKAELGAQFSPKANDTERSGELRNWFLGLGYDAAEAGSEIVVFDPKKLVIVGQEQVPTERERMKAILQRFQQTGEAVSEQEILQHMASVEKVARRVVVSRWATSKFQRRKEVPKAKGKGTTTVYEYSDRQVTNRNREKAKKIEKLRGNLHKLRAAVKRDLKSKDPKTRLTALVVGLMNDTYERVGNDESAKGGHVGVTGWKPEHVKLSGGKATFTYVGKSGVKQTKETSDVGLVSILKEAIKNKTKGDTLFTYDGGTVKATDVNAYLEPHGITAKDIRGLHANREVQTRLKAIRGKGGKLPTDKKERKTKLKAEFQQALDDAAKAVGHEASTLRSQYLVPGIEDNFLRDGTVKVNLAKQGSTQTMSRRAFSIRRILERATRVKAVFPWGVNEGTDISKVLGPQLLGWVYYLAGRWYSYGVGDRVPHLAMVGEEQALRRLRGPSSREATKTKGDKEQDEVERLLRRNPKKRPPRRDLRRNRMKPEDDDIEGYGQDGDRDLSLNYKRIGSVDRVAHRWFHYVVAKSFNPKHAPGKYWQSDSGTWVGKDQSGETRTFGGGENAEDLARSYARGISNTTNPKEKEEKKEKKEKGIRTDRYPFESDVTFILDEAEKDGTVSEDVALAVLDLVEDPKLFKAFKIEMSAMQKQLAKDGISVEMMKDLARDPFKGLDTTDPDAVANALIHSKVRERLLLDPSNVGGKPLSSEPLSSDARVERALTSMKQFRRVSKDQRVAVAKKAVEQLKSLDEGSPEAAELNSIIDGIHAATSLNDEPFDVRGSDGHLLREPLSPKLGLLLKQMVRQGDAGILFLADNDQVYQAVGRGAIRDAVGHLDDRGLIALAKGTPWESIGKVLEGSTGVMGPTLDPRVAEFLRDMLRDMGVDSMTTVQGCVAAIARTKPDADTSTFEKVRKGMDKVIQEKVKPGVDSTMADCVAGGEDVKACLADAPDRLRRMQLEGTVDVMDEAERQPDPQDVAVAAARTVAQGADISLLDDKTLRREKPVAEQRRDYLKGVVDPAERDRIQHMTDQEFLEEIQASPEDRMNP